MREGGPSFGRMRRRGMGQRPRRREPGLCGRRRAEGRAPRLCPPAATSHPTVPLNETGRALRPDWLDPATLLLPPDPFPVRYLPSALWHLNLFRAGSEREKFSPLTITPALPSDRLVLREK